MRKNDLIIRLEKKEDYRMVENLVREAFWNVYRPGCLEHYVLNRLRNDGSFIPELDFVMEKGGKIIGQNVFVKANIKADDGNCVPIVTMGQICITPELKRQGYGKILLDYSLQQALFFLLHHLKTPAVSPYNNVGLICKIKAWKPRLGYFHAFISFQLYVKYNFKFRAFIRRTVYRY